MSDLIFPVRYIFTNYLKNNNVAYFNIPDYQRGYKWNAESVCILLDDLKKFELPGNKNNFYCLQNITIIQATDSDGNLCFNVIDGQQRLTTLYILLSFLKYKGLENFNFSKDILKYAIRLSTAKTLSERIYTGNLWKDGEIKPENAEHKDEYYIMEVAKAISEWYDNKNLDSNTILDSLQIIVNKLTPVEKSDNLEQITFTSLNSGKVNLDGADLVRAVFMTRSVRERFQDLGSEGKKREYRVRLGMEIDELNRWWSDKDVQFYYEQFLPVSLKNEKSLFNQTNLPINLLYKLFFDLNRTEIDENKINFAFFENGKDFNNKSGDDNWEMYEKVLELHHLLKDWYEDDEIYNLLGFIMFNLKQEPYSCKFNSEIITLWEYSKSKKEFKSKLKNLISDKLFEISNESEKQADSIDGRIKISEISDITHSWYEDGRILILLSLMDIVPLEDKVKVIRQKATNFAVTKETKEDKEHILPQHPSGEDDVVLKTGKDWKEYLQKNFVEESDRQIIEKIRDLLPEDDSVEMSNETIAQINELLNKEGLNSVGNIVILDQSTNRSYHAASYKDKLNRITYEYFAGKVYIHPFTAEVFFQTGSNKIYREKKWGLSEIKQNTKHIVKRLSAYFDFGELDYE